MNRDRAVKILNEALALDPDAVDDLLAQRVHVNAALADHPTIAVRGYEGPPTLSLLGLLNGMLEPGEAMISAYVDGTRIERFE